MSHRSTDFSFGEQTPRPFPHISSARILHARGIWFDDVVQRNRIAADHAAETITQFCISHLIASTSTSTIEHYRTGIPLLHAIFRVLMCGINRFNPSSSTANDSSLTPRDFQLTHGSNQLQLHKTMPLLQAVAKRLAQRGTLESDKVDDFVLDILRRPSAPLGTSPNDVQLAAAFITFLLTSTRANGQSQSATSILQALHLPPGPSFLHHFLETFFPALVPSSHPQISETIFQDETALALVSSLLRYFHTFDQTLFTTKSGYLGNGPPGLKVGDRVAVLDGAKMPFAMRSVEGEVGRWVLVGPCYVEGLSDGEPACMARRGEVAVQDILIC